MIKRLFHTAIGSLAMLVCAGVAMIIPPLWQGVGGRDFRPQATTMAVLILIMGITFRRVLRWQVLDFILPLCIIEFLTLCIIAHFSGFTGLELFHWFNLSWLGVMSIFVGLPWLVGLGAGSVWLRISRGRHAGA